MDRKTVRTQLHIRTTACKYMVCVGNDLAVNPCLSCVGTLQKESVLIGFLWASNLPSLSYLSLDISFSC